MNKDFEKRRILRFLRGQGKRMVDAFGIYQWIERCHYHTWWDLGHQLGSHIPPGSLDLDYHRRLEFLLSECRSKLNDQFVEIKREDATKVLFVPKSFANTCESLGISFGGKTEQRVTLAYLGKKITILEELDAAGCYFHFLETDKKQLIQWLDNHGFQHLIQGNIKMKEFQQRRSVRIRASWNDLSDLIEKIFEEAKLKILKKIIINALFKRGLKWRGCLNYLELYYGINITDPSIEAIHQALIKALTEKGHVDLAHSIS